MVSNMGGGKIYSGALPKNAHKHLFVIAELFDTKISLSYDERINRVIVKIMKESTEEVIRQIPPEEVVELTAKLREDFRGLIFNRTG